MAYGLKYFFEFGDQHGQREYRVEILEDGFTGNAAEVVDASDRPVELEYKGKEDVFQNPVVPSVCHVRIIAKQQSEFRDLVSNDQFKHIMKLKAKINGTFELIWAGIHMPDIYKEVFGSTPYELELKFTDGLGQLKNIEYKPIGNTDVGTSFQSTADILAQALGELPSEIDTSIFEYIDIREDATNLKLLDNTRPNSVLNQHYLNEQAFFKDQRTEDASGNLTRDQEFIDCYEVIQRVCKTFQAKIFKGGLDLSGPPRSNPVYRIVTVNLHNSTANFFGIDPTQTGNSSQALEIRNEENLAASAINANFKTEAVLEGSEAELEFYLAVSQVLLEYKGQPKKDNIIEEGNFQYRDTRPGGTSAPSGFSRQIDWNEQTSSTVHGWSASIPGLQLNTGTLKSDTYSTDASKLRFHVKAKLSFDVSNVPGASGVDNLPGFIAKQIPNQFVISPEIKFTDNNGNDVFLNTPGNLNLSGSVTKLNMIVKQPLYEAEVEGEFVTGFVGANDLVITLDGLNTFSVVDQNRNSYNIEPLVQYEFIKLTNEDTDLDVVSKTNNASVANNANVDDRKLDIPHSDSATGNDASAIGIKDSNGEIIDTENWDKGFGKYSTTLSHLKLLAREYLHNWEDYRRRIKGSLTFGDKMLFNKLLVITEDGTDYGMMFYFHRWDLRHALIDFEAIEGIYNKGKAESTDPDTPIYDNPREEVALGTFSTNAPVINADSPDINIEDITTDNATVRPSDVPKLIRLDDISASGATVSLPLISFMNDEIITIHTQTDSGNSLDIKTQSPDVFENGATSIEFTGSQKIELAFKRSTNEWITL
jgi:hypothetical protein